jgi:hypothetical protein
MRIDVAAKACTQALHRFGQFAFWNIGGAVKGHVLNKVGKAALIIALIL